MAVPVPVSAVPGIPTRASQLSAGLPGQGSEGRCGYYAGFLPGDCSPEYFSALWEDEFKSDLRQDSLGTALDHHRKFGLGKARVGGRVNMSLVDAPQSLADERHGAYTQYRLTTPHKDNYDNPLESLPQYFERPSSKTKKEPVRLIAGGLEHIHLMPGDLREEVAHEKAHAKAEGWLHTDKKKPFHLEARLESGAHLPPEGYIARVVVTHLLEGRTLGVEIHGTKVTRISNKKASEFGWLVGDQILKLNGRIVSNNLEFQQKMEHAENVLRMSGRPIVFEVWRGVQHSFSGSQAELPLERFARPMAEGNSLQPAPASVRPLALPQPSAADLAAGAEAQVAQLAWENAELRSRLDAELWSQQLQGPQPWQMQPGPVIGFQAGPPPASMAVAAQPAIMMSPFGSPVPSMMQPMNAMSASGVLPMDVPPASVPPMGLPLANVLPMGQSSFSASMMQPMDAPSASGMLPLGLPPATVQPMGLLPASASMMQPMDAPSASGLLPMGLPPASASMMQPMDVMSTGGMLPMGLSPASVPPMGPPSAGVPSVGMPPANVLPMDLLPAGALPMRPPFAG